MLSAETHFHWHDYARAYGFSMASNYNSSPLAAEILLCHGTPRLIRARQTLDDLIRGESSPADLYGH